MAVVGDQPEEFYYIDFSECVEEILGGFIGICGNRQYNRRKSILWKVNLGGLRVFSNRRVTD